MNYEEALKELKYDNEERDWDNCMFDMAGEVYEKCVEALEKQIPKTPYAETAFYGACPSCSRTIDTDYCEYCGQAIDWRGGIDEH